MRHTWFHRSAFLATVIVFSGLFTHCRMSQKTQVPPASEQKVKSNQESPLSIHQRAIAIDMHADTTQRLVDEGLDIGKRAADGHFDSVRAREGGLDAQFFSIWVEPQLFGGGGAVAVKRADVQI